MHNVDFYSFIHLLYPLIPIQPQKKTVESSFLSPSSPDCLLSQNPSVLILVLHTEPNTEVHNIEGAHFIFHSCCVESKLTASIKKDQSHVLYVYCFTLITQDQCFVHYNNILFYFLSTRGC